MRFQVPQFIDIEDKIFGPFTFRQFIYLGGGAGGVYALWKILPVYFSIFLIPIVAGLALALAFYRVNNKPFIVILEAGFKYFFQSKLYIWKKEKPNVGKKKEAAPAENPTASFIPKLSDSKLKDLSWSLDVLDTSKTKS